MTYSTNPFLNCSYHCQLHYRYLYPNLSSTNSTSNNSLNNSNNNLNKSVKSTSPTIGLTANKNSETLLLLRDTTRKEQMLSNGKQGEQTNPVKPNQPKPVISSGLNRPPPIYKQYDINQKYETFTCNKLIGSNHQTYQHHNTAVHCLDGMRTCPRNKNLNINLNAKPTPPNPTTQTPPSTSQSQKDSMAKAKFLRDYINNGGDAASLIVHPYLFLGGHRSVNDPNELHAKGVTHVLNMARELKLDAEELAKKNIKLMHISARDGKTYNMRNDFEKAFQFIDDALRTKGKIIINCARGISRSATIVIAYLMYRYNLRLSDAYMLLLRLRPQIRPNSNFRRQLELFEQELIYIRYKEHIQLRINSHFNKSPYNF